MENRDTMIQEALREIQRGTAEIIDKERIEKLLKAYFDEGKTYTVKAGFDPNCSRFTLRSYCTSAETCNFSKIWC